MKPRGSQTEAAFQLQVTQLAKLYGWSLIYHTHDSRRSNPGFPDLVLVRGGELIFAELKTDSGRLRPEQETWIAGLQVVADANPHVEVYLWRPGNFDEMHERLARGRHRLTALYRATEEAA